MNEHNDQKEDVIEKNDSQNIKRRDARRRIASLGQATVFPKLEGLRLAVGPNEVDHLGSSPYIDQYVSFIYQSSYDSYRSYVSYTDQYRSYQSYDSWYRSIPPYLSYNSYSSHYVSYDSHYRSYSSYDS